MATSAAMSAMTYRIRSSTGKFRHNHTTFDACRHADRLVSWGAVARLFLPPAAPFPANAARRTHGRSRRAAATRRSVGHPVIRDAGDAVAGSEAPRAGDEPGVGARAPHLRRDRRRAVPAPRADRVIVRPARAARDAGHAGVALGAPHVHPGRRV